MRITLLILVCISLGGCYSTISIEGFDKSKWNNAPEDCSPYRVEIVDLIIENEDLILEGTQNEVESLLGRAEEHELYNRNQKFFHYRLTPPDECGEVETIQFLSVRFNAIGRANLVQVMLRESQ